MSQQSNHAVNGFYPWPVPVSLSDQAAVFVYRGKLYREDCRRNVLEWACPNEVTQVVQAGDSIFALEWSGQGEAALRKLDHQLRTVEYRVLFQGGPARPEREPDPYDLEDWRNQKEYCLLTENWVFRMTFQADGESPDLTGALVLNCTPLEGGATIRHRIGRQKIEKALGGTAKFCYFEVRAGDSQMWAYGDRVFFNAGFWDGALCGYRHVTLQIRADGALTVLWESPDLREGRPCFFDFDRDIMWTCSRQGDAEHPEDAVHRRQLPMVARRIAPGAPVLPGLPVWEGIAMFQPYFDGVHDFSSVEGAWIVPWKDRLLAAPEGAEKSGK